LLRFFDILFSITGLILLSPIFLVIALVIVIDSRGGVFFLHKRVGKDGHDFRVVKFRTMAAGAEKQGGLTISARDSRITQPGYFLRRYKLDELPQLFNVLKGEMSLVGPRPEIREYVNLYTEEQKKVLSVKPGITDYASIEYSNENEILGRAADPGRTYIEEIMPAKILLNKRFIENRGVKEYFRILLRTAFRVARN
jgi:lipopolysaccharide/colanic/teichoic acid biosynthesis glycosyltransferase